jgi:IS30 family transposase
MQGDKAVILTNVERKTGFLVATKVEDKTAFNIYLKTLEIFKKIPKKKKLSITYDN